MITGGDYTSVFLLNITGKIFFFRDLELQPFRDHNRSYGCGRYQHITCVFFTYFHIFSPISCLAGGGGEGSNPNGLILTVS